MLAAATTAAAAPDIIAGPPPAPVYTDTPDSWRSGYFFTDSFDGATNTSQWVRLRLPWGSPQWGVTWRFGSTFTGHYRFTIYRSANPAEDGSTLEQTGQWDGANGNWSAGAGTLPDSVWVYVQATPLAPFVAEGSATAYAQIDTSISAQVKAATTVTAGHYVKRGHHARVDARTSVSVASYVVRAMRVWSTTWVRLGQPIAPLPAWVSCSSSCTVLPPPPPVPGDVVGAPDPIQGRTVVHLAGPIAGTPDDVLGSTDVQVGPGGAVRGTPAQATGSTRVLLVTSVELTDNPPIQLGFESHAELRLTVPEDDLFVPGNSPRRTLPVVSFAMPTPIIVAGKPYVPRWRAQVRCTAKATQGSKHIRATDPAPKWNSTTGKWDDAPDGPAWAGRWVVDDLPDPPTDGYYWLGDPTWADGTGNYKAGRTRWSPHASTPNAPAWRSFFPYKPSVRAVDSFLPDGGVVHHPKGVHFNSEFVEHMWADFGGARRQPFTWVIAGMIAGFPSTHYRHYLLDAGRNPDKVHFPRLSATDVYQPHTIDDGLDYRSLISYSRDGQLLCTRPSLHGPHHVRARVDPHRGRPKMFFGVFNGPDSYVGAFGPNSKRIAKGRVDNGPLQHHRYYVLGRAQGAIDQDKSSHLLVFEIRYWRHALSRLELELQYDQLASTYQFHRYRRV